jgi:transglutaminase-like putative cysteine protease
LCSVTIFGLLKGYKKIPMIKYLSVFSVSFILVFTACQSDSDNDKTVQVEQKVSIEDVEKGIRANIEKRVREGDGYFNYQADTLNLRLKLVRVHTEYLSILGSGSFFACVDLATENGDVYDVDFFLEGSVNEMEVTRTELHKLNGKPYYTWKQAGDKSWYTIPLQNATNDLLGVIEDKDNFTFTYEIQLPELSGPAQIWIPVAQSDHFQKVEIISFQIPVKQNMIRDAEFGNSIMFLELLPEHSHEKISLGYRVERIEKSPYPENDTNPVKYLQASVFLPVGDRFTAIAEATIAEKQAVSPLTKARALYDYIIDNMRYAKEGIYGTGDANYACDVRSGNCTEFHSFFISLSRSAGIPARFAVGAAIPSERNEGGVDGYHCWAEFYAEGKWWPVDISEANKYTPLATYYFGHHSANRIEFSRGRDLKPDPMPQSGPINFFAYPVLEVEGELVSVETRFTFKREDAGI